MRFAIKNSSTDQRLFSILFIMISNNKTIINFNNNTYLNVSIHSKSKTGCSKDGFRVCSAAGQTSTGMSFDQVLFAKLFALNVKLQSCLS